MADWQDDQQSNRRFTHRSRKSAGGSTGQTFKPRSMLGRYALRSPFFEKLASSKSEKADMWLEIHELVETETGFVATFDLGVVKGVLLLAGSRRALQDVVDEIEEQEGEEEGEEKGDSDEASEEEDEEEDDDKDDKDERDVISFLPPPEVARPTHAFEKNTFRTPKWFAQWRGSITSATTNSKSASADPKESPSIEKGDSSDQTSGQEEVLKHDGDGTHGATTTSDPDNKAHFEFSSGACRDFNATFSCPALNAKEVAIQGWKVTGKPSTAACRWSEFDT